MIKKYIRIGTLVIILLLGLSVMHLKKQNDILREDVSTLTLNEKAFIAENSGLKNQSRAFKFTIEQLNYFNDSLLNKMNEVKKELKIKDKNIKHMEYLLSTAHKRDSIILRDTIFKERGFILDTLMGDKWYQTNLKLEYPSSIKIVTTVTSEKYVMVHTKKETIKPPKKFFLWRWFQRKHEIAEVEVVEKNPYIINKQTKFIEIIK